MGFLTCLGNLGEISISGISENHDSNVWMDKCNLLKLNVVQEKPSRLGSSSKELSGIMAGTRNHSPPGELPANFPATSFSRHRPHQEERLEEISNFLKSIGARKPSRAGHAHFYGRRLNLTRRRVRAREAFQATRLLLQPRLPPTSIPTYLVLPSEPCTYLFGIFVSVSPPKQPSGEVPATFSPPQSLHVPWEVFFYLSGEKLVGSENYLSWSASVELWFMGQGYEDHLVTQEADIPEVDRVQWRKIDAQPKDYTRMISSVFIRWLLLLSISANRTWIYLLILLDKFFMVLTLIGLRPDLEPIRDQILGSSSVPSLDDVFARLLLVPEVEANVLIAPIAINLATLAIVAISYMEDLLALPIWPSPLILRCLRLRAPPHLRHLRLLLPLLPSLDLFSSITTTSDLPTVTLTNGSQTVAKGPEYGEDDWHRTRWFLVFSTLSSLPCESCQLGKHTRVSFPKRLNNRAKSPFELVHTDVWGPCRTASTLGFQYFVTFIDDYSRLTMPGNIFQPNLLRLCLIMGFFMQSSCAHTPQQNGVLPIPIVSPPDAMPPRPLQVYHRRPRVVAPLPFPEAPADSLPIPSASPAPALPSPNDLPIAVRKGTRSTRNPHPIYNFLSIIDYLHPILLLFLLYPLFLFHRSTHEALSHPGWRQAMVDEMTALHSNDTWDLVVYPSGKSTVGCRWVYAVKVGPDGQVDRLKARLVAKGYTQVYGSDYGDTFSPVAKIASVRLLLSMVAMCSWPLYQLDIKNAFLHGDLADEVYMEQPPGFVAQGESGLVCRLRRSLYGLKQSPSSMCIYLVVYVDDIVITGSDQDGIQKLKQHLFTHFQTKDLGKLKYFLGIEIAQSSFGVVLSQRKYALDILEETGMLDCKPVDTPMDPNVKLVPGQGEPLGDPGRYRRLVAMWDAVIRILRYIKSTPGKGVLYENRGHTQVVGYTDADWADSPTDRRSTSGYCVFIGGNLISWKSKKQDELRFGKDEQMKLICDNQAALHIASNPVFHERTKHIEVDCHFIREKIASGCVATSFVNSNDQLADIFTKSLRGPRIKYICNKLGAYDGSFKLEETAPGVATGMILSLRERGSRQPYNCKYLTEDLALNRVGWIKRILVADPK
ncbi:Retrovirus-related Pol polyprotein from transposon RE1 [Vitis vinifera]|uniref:Retrovirus-related Pol polyprotein from transposon RE1 n=1 Tax=Vitis vinifera TaxID=29760 RepID=A0A438F006_VITVI|nr:Retrovirus-related Pol polyprotein from transposon RE1 [Vitis vinifera]